MAARVVRSCFSDPHHPISETIGVYDRPVASEEYRRQAYETWETMAPGWEKWRAPIEATSLPVREWMIRELAPRPGDTILELAAGFGDTGQAAAEIVGESGRVISTDFSPTMVDIARRRGDELGLTNVEYRVMDAERIELEDDSVDGVLCRWGYMLMPDPAAALAETRRVLQPAGRLTLAVWREAERNPWISIVGRMLLARGHVPPPEPGAPGMFTMARDERIRELLEGRRLQRSSHRGDPGALHLRQPRRVHPSRARHGRRLREGLAAGARRRARGDGVGARRCFRAVRGRRALRVPRPRGRRICRLNRMPALPQLDGVVFRPFRGASDYAAIARIITAHAKGEGDDRVETPENTASAYDHLERCEPDRDLLVAEVDGRPIAYTRVWWDQEPDGPRVYRQVCFLDPAFGSRGIGSALFGWGQERLREIAAEHDAPDKLLEAWALDRNEAAVALIRGAGFEPITYAAEMVRPSVTDLPDHPLPDGLEVRPVTDDQLREIWEADIEAFRDHWGYVEPTEVGYTRFLAYPYNDPTLWKVAWDEEGVAGQVRSFINPEENAENGRERGWTENISTARRWRRRGVAKALIVESIRELASRGMTEVALGVHTENPNGAFDLYAGLGYEVVGTSTTYRKPLA